MVAVKYFIFAFISTSFNLLFQYISFIFYYGEFSLYVAMLIGTLVGLVTKYTLDKKYIFYHAPKNKTDDARKFLKYSFMGGGTTIIFWGTEIAFDAMYQNTNAKYLGAIVGLSIGYTVKYFLDKKFVFVNKNSDIL